jgi:hypothetical protein
LTSAAKAAIQNKTVIAALKRCATRAAPPALRHPRCVIRAASSELRHLKLRHLKVRHPKSIG